MYMYVFLYYFQSFVRLKFFQGKYFLNGAKWKEEETERDLEHILFM